MAPDDREPFREAREAGLRARHEQRLENATYTAAEVKVLTEEACKVTYELGRQQALDEVVGALIAEGATQRAIAIVRAIQAQDATSGRTDPGDPNG